MGSALVSGEDAPKPVTVATAIELVASTKRDVDKQIQSDGPLGPDRNEAALRGAVSFPRASRRPE